MRAQASFLCNGLVTYINHYSMPHDTGASRILLEVRLPSFLMDLLRMHAIDFEMSRGVVINEEDYYCPDSFGVDGEDGIDNRSLIGKLHTACKFLLRTNIAMRNGQCPPLYADMALPNNVYKTICISIRADVLCLAYDSSVSMCEELRLLVVAMVSVATKHSPFSELIDALDEQHKKMEEEDLRVKRLEEENKNLLEGISDVKVKDEKESKEDNVRVVE